MSKDEQNGENNWARVCDTCRSVACTVYCRADSVYLCTTCDAQVHIASRHERVLICDSCERAPAAFFCKADAASLCIACDSEIHSVNSLAKRHQRLPILPISGTIYGSMANQNPNETVVTDTETGLMMVGHDDDDDDDDEEAASWLLLNPGKNNNGFSDEYLNLVDYNSSMENQYTDQYNQYQQDHGVVPLQVEESRCQQSFQLGITYSSPRASYSSMNHHSALMSSMEMGVVPESTTRDMTVISHSRPSKGTTDLLTHPPIQTMPQFVPMDREARVLRYKEKKKMRKFEKTIRYASRKAYAEQRPRIKGRFVKRINVEAEVNQTFSTSPPMQELGYGIVPSF